MKAKAVSKEHLDKFKLLIKLPLTDAHGTKTDVIGYWKYSSK